MTIILDPTDSYATEDAAAQTGKFYKVNVPNYQDSTNYDVTEEANIQHPSTYIRLGAGATGDDPQHLIAQAVCGLDPLANPPQSAAAVAQAYANADAITSNNGGHREHTDGDRIVTTYGTYLNVVNGAYHEIILSNQNWNELNLPWTGEDELPDGSGYRTDVLGQINNCISCDNFYDVVSTQAYPGMPLGPDQDNQKQYGEGVLLYSDYNNYWNDHRTYQAKVNADPPDPTATPPNPYKNGNLIPQHYEYVNNQDHRTVACIQNSMAEKLYAGQALSVVCTRYTDDDHTHYEDSDYVGWSEGDLWEYLCTRNYQGSIDATGDISDSRHSSGGDIEETTTADSGDITSTDTANSGTIHEVRNASIIREESTATAFLETRIANAGINAVTTAGAEISELTITGGANIDAKMTGAANVDVRLAGGANVDISAAVVTGIDVKTALVALVDLAAAFAVFDFVIGVHAFDIQIAQATYDVKIGVNHMESTFGYKCEMHEASAKVAGEVNVLAGTDTGIKGVAKHVFGMYSMM